MNEKGYLHRRSRSFSKADIALTLDTTLTDGAYRLYHYMHWRYGSNCDNHEGQLSMADALGVSQPTISNRIVELVEHDWVIVKQRNGRQGRVTNFYHIFECQDDCRAWRAKHHLPKPEIERKRKPQRKTRKGIGGRPSHKPKAQASSPEPPTERSTNPTPEPTPDKLEFMWADKLKFIHPPAAVHELEFIESRISSDPDASDPNSVPAADAARAAGAAGSAGNQAAARAFIEAVGTTDQPTAAETPPLVPCAPAPPHTRPDKPKVFNLKRTSGRVLMNEERIYIGRASGAYGQSKWANPYRIDLPTEKRDGNRAEVLDKYRHDLLDSPDLLAALPELRGKSLYCWCSPEPCHGDILAALSCLPDEQIFALVVDAERRKHTVQEPSTITVPEGYEARYELTQVDCYTVHFLKVGAKRTYCERVGKQFAISPASTVPHMKSCPKCAKAGHGKDYLQLIQVWVDGLPQAMIPPDFTLNRWLKLGARLRDDARTLREIAQATSLIAAWYTAQTAPPIHFMAERDLNAALIMRSRGITPDDVKDYITERQADPWWTGKPISIEHLAKSLPAWAASRQVALPDH